MNFIETYAFIAAADEENKPRNEQSLKTIADFYATMAQLKFWVYWTNISLAQKGDAFYEKHIDDCMLDADEKERLCRNAAHKVCKQLMSLHAIKVFLPRDKTGSFADRNAVCEELLEIVEDAGIRLTRNYLDKLNRLC